MTVLKRHVLHVKAGDMLWMKTDSFDGNYIHHEPRSVRVSKDLTDQERLILNGDTLVEVDYGGSNDVHVLVPLCALHATKSQAWCAWIQDAITAGMRPEFVAQAQYNAAAYCQSYAG